MEKPVGNVHTTEPPDYPRTFEEWYRWLVIARELLYREMNSKNISR